MPTFGVANKASFISSLRAAPCALWSEQSCPSLPPSLVSTPPSNTALSLLRSMNALDFLAVECHCCNACLSCSSIYVRGGAGMYKQGSVLGSLIWLLRCFLGGYCHFRRAGLTGQHQDLNHPVQMLSVPISRSRYAWPDSKFERLFANSGGVPYVLRTRSEWPTYSRLRRPPSSQFVSSLH